MMAVEQNSSAFLSAAVADMDRIWHELGSECGNYHRAAAVKKGLARGAKYLDILGVFIEVPVISKIECLDGMVRLWPATPGRRGVRHYLTTMGDIADVRRINGKLLWDQKRWLISDSELCSIGIPTLMRIRTMLQAVNGVPVKA